jgi:hypothetical protein
VVSFEAPNDNAFELRKVAKVPETMIANLRIIQLKHFQVACVCKHTERIIGDI